MIYSVKNGMIAYLCLSFLGGVAVYTVTPGTGQIWLDDVRCIGSETTIVSCPHRPIGTHNCNHNEDIGVSCRNQGKTIP